mgnify:CR=1 FL=1
MELKRNDILLIGAVLVICLGISLFLFLNKKRGRVALLKYGQGQEMRIDLNKDAHYDLESNQIQIHLEVKDHGIAFIHSECPDHICERYGYIKNVGETAVCLPARASVTVLRQ